MIGSVEWEDNQLEGVQRPQYYDIQDGKFPKTKLIRSVI